MINLSCRRFQPGEGPSRGLLCDCKNRLWNRWIVLQHYQGPGQHRQDPGGGPQPARLVRREAEGDQAAGGELCPGLESGVLLYTIQCIVASGRCFRLGALLTERDQLCQHLYRLPDVLNWLVSLSQVKDFLFLISFIF